MYQIDGEAKSIAFRGYRFIYNRSKVPQKLISSQFDKVIKCFGIRPQNAFTRNLVSLDENGYIKVNEHLQVLDTEGTPLPNVYACGDCMTSVNKAEKFAFLIYYQSEIVIKNLELYSNEKVREPKKWAVYKDSKLPRVAIAVLGDKALQVDGGKASIGKVNKCTKEYVRTSVVSGLRGNVLGKLGYWMNNKFLNMW